MTSYTYNRIFYGNILVVGRTECGKTRTRFAQKLAVNSFFGNLVKTEWVSNIRLDEVSKAKIQSCFKCEVEFQYPKSKETFDNLLEEFKNKSNESDPTQDDTHSVNSDNFGERSKRDRLIVMDDASGLADSSRKFINFLTVSRKFRYHCVLFFTQYTQKRAFGRQYFHRQTF